MILQDVWIFQSLIFSMYQTVQLLAIVRMNFVHHLLFRKQYFPLHPKLLFGVGGAVWRCRWSKFQRWTSDDQSPYFKLGKGVVAYTLLCDHIPLNGYLIGAHEYEAHHVFDIWYRSTSDDNRPISPFFTGSVCVSNPALPRQRACWKNYTTPERYKKCLSSL